MPRVERGKSTYSWCIGSDTDRHDVGAYRADTLRVEGYKDRLQKRVAAARASSFDPLDPRNRAFQRAEYRGGNVVVFSKLARVSHDNGCASVCGLKSQRFHLRSRA